MGYLERYRRGEYRQVWAELQELGGAARAGSLGEEASAVARETMNRAAVNVRAIVERP